MLINYLYTDINLKIKLKKEIDIENIINYLNYNVSVSFSGFLLNNFNYNLDNDFLEYNIGFLIKTDSPHEFFSELSDEQKNRISKTSVQNKLDRIYFDDNYLDEFKNIKEFLNENLFFELISLNIEVEPILDTTYKNVLKQINNIIFYKNNIVNENNLYQ